MSGDGEEGTDGDVAKLATGFSPSLGPHEELAGLLLRPLLLLRLLPRPGGTGSSASTFTAALTYSSNSSNSGIEYTVHDQRKQLTIVLSYHDLDLPPPGCLPWSAPPRYQMS